MAVVLALGAALSWGCGDFLGGVTSKRLSSFAVVFLSQVAALVPFGILVLLTQPKFGGTDFFVLAGLAGIGEAVALAAFYRGLAIGAMGVVAPVAALSAGIPLAFGLAAGESLSTFEAAGAPLALVGVAMVAWVPGGIGEARGHLSVGVGLALVAAVGFGSFFVTIDAAADRGDVISSVFICRLTLVAAVGSAVLLVRPTLSGAAPLAVSLIAIGVLDIGAATLYAAATTHGLLAVVGVLGALYPIVVVILARFVLKERLSISQRAGTAIALAGLAMMSAVA